MKENSKAQLLKIKALDEYIGVVRLYITEESSFSWNK